jgi:hypothetical protein
MIQDPNKQSYEQGWNDRWDNIWMTVTDSTPDYRLGYHECDILSERERERIGKL